jgi:hypothetical protein
MGIGDGPQSHHVHNVIGAILRQPVGVLDPTIALQSPAMQLIHSSWLQLLLLLQWPPIGAGETKLLSGSARLFL